MLDSRIELETRPTKPFANELTIINAAREDPKAFGELYLMYVRRIFRYLYSRIRNVEEAEDVTTQTFMAAFESFPKFREKEHFASWLFMIARNKAMDHFRYGKNLPSLEEIDEIPIEFDPLSGVIRAEQAAALAKLVEVLPDKDRELLRLRFLGEMTFTEIAHLLHKNEEAVKKSIYRLLARLHSQLEVSNE